MNVTHESFKLLLLFSNNAISKDLGIAESTFGDDTPFLGVPTYLLPYLYYQDIKLKTCITYAHKSFIFLTNMFLLTNFLN